MRLFLAVLPVVLLAACAPPYPGDGATSAGDASPAPSVAAAPAANALPVAAADEQAVRAALKKNLPEAQIDAVRGTPLPGVYEIQSGLNFGYVSADGRYLIEGDLHDLPAGKAITEDNRRVARAALLATVPMDQSIEFAPQGKAKYEVTVFTDVDCGYCRMLHKHIAEYNAEGIAVRYLFFPRSGADTESFYKAEEVWCSADRQKALTDAKAGIALTAGKSCPNPVAEHLKLAGMLGLRGTPAIILSDGEMIPGYQSPEQLLQTLAEHDGKSAPAMGDGTAPG